MDTRCQACTSPLHMKWGGVFWCWIFLFLQLSLDLSTKSRWAVDISVDLFRQPHFHSQGHWDRCRWCNALQSVWVICFFMTLYIHDIHLDSKMSSLHFCGRRSRSHALLLFWTQYIRKARRKFHHIWHKHSLRHKDDQDKRSNVKVTVHTLSH